MERYEASEGEEEVRRASGRGKNKGKYDSGLAELDTSFDDDNEQVVFSVGETKRTSSGNATDSQFDNHYSQITPKSYQFKALFRKNFKLQVPLHAPHSSRTNYMH
jgi:hypothetical protein